MKRIFTLLLMAFITSQAYCQFELIGEIVPGEKIWDIANRGTDIYAALGTSGVYKSTDEGNSWTALEALPDVGIGQEGAFALLIASNGDIIVGGNNLYGSAPLGGVAFRSSDDGASWTGTVVNGITGYEYCEKILETESGHLFMLAGQSNFYHSTLSTSDWTQTPQLGGVIYGFETFGDTILVMNNPAGGNAGLWYTTNYGTSWENYGSNGASIGAGTVVVSPMLITNDYKFVGNGGLFGETGIWRAGISDTLWTLKNDGIDYSYLYPTTMASDNVSMWLIFQSVDQCYLTSSDNWAQSWSTPEGGQPQNTGSAICMEKLLPVGNHLYGYIDNSIYYVKNVAVPNVGIENHKIHSVNIYPNPNKTGIFNVDMDPSMQIYSYSIVNLLGQITYSDVNNFESFSLNLSNLVDGVYFINLYTDQGAITTKVILDKE